MKHELIIGKYTLESLTNGMYASPLDLYREYIQNSVDSFDEAIDMGLENRDKLIISIDINAAERSVVIHDNGCGIRSQDAIKTLLDIGNSQKNRVTTRGFRGIGRLAGLSYCDKLTFRTSYMGESTATIIEFDALLLRDLLLPGRQQSESVEDVIEKIVSVRTKKEASHRRYFEVELTGLWDEAGLTDLQEVKSYLTQHAPLCFSKSFKWGNTVTEKVRLNGCSISQYNIRLNGEMLYKPYQDSFTSDRVRKNLDTIRDIKVETFYRKGNVSAVLWYADTNFYGTILDPSIKGLRVRQGNMLIGDKTTCNNLFKEERFNGWLVGELHITDSEIVVNSRRDGFEKNSAYYELVSNLKEWAAEISKSIRHLSYERSLSSSKKAIVEAEQIDDIADENALYYEDLTYAEDYGEHLSLDKDESTEVAEVDYITKLELFLNQKKYKTKYTALNINTRLTGEQRRILERVFDLISLEYDQELADDFVNVISAKF